MHRAGLIEDVLNELESYAYKHGLEELEFKIAAAKKALKAEQGKKLREYSETLREHKKPNFIKSR